MPGTDLGPGDKEQTKIYFPDSCKSMEGNRPQAHQCEN